jgi:hypothetical protein
MKCKTWEGFLCASDGQNSSEGREIAHGIRVLATQAWWPEFSLQNPHPLENHLGVQVHSDRQRMTAVKQCEERTDSWKVVVWYTHTCTHTCTYTCVHIRLHMHTCTHAYVCTHEHMCTHGPIRTYAHVYTHEHTHVYACHMHIHAYTCTHIYIGTYLLKSDMSSLQIWLWELCDDTQAILLLGGLVMIPDICLTHTFKWTSFKCTMFFEKWHLEISLPPSQSLCLSHH